MTNREIRQKTGHHKRAWCRLTGLFSREIPKWLVAYKDCEVIIDEDEPIVYVNVRNDLVRYSIRCHMKTREIYISLCKFKINREGIATAALKFKLNIACSMRFEFLACRASADFDNGIQYKGYIVWGKLGFTMRNEDDIECFRSKTYLPGQTFRFLHELLITPAGEKKWESKGFSWSAIFLLERNSINKQLFRAYRQIRGLI